MNKNIVFPSHIYRGSYSYSCPLTVSTVGGSPSEEVYKSRSSLIMVTDTRAGGDRRVYLKSHWNPKSQHAMMWNSSGVEPKDGASLRSLTPKSGSKLGSSIQSFRVGTSFPRTPVQLLGGVTNLSALCQPPALAPGASSKSHRCLPVVEHTHVGPTSSLGSRGTARPLRPRGPRGGRGSGGVEWRGSNRGGFGGGDVTALVELPF